MIGGVSEALPTDHAARIEALRAEASSVGLWRGLRADVKVNIGEAERLGGRLAVALRASVSPTIRFCFLARMAARAHRSHRWIWRNFLIALHGTEVYTGAVIEPGIRIPVPFGVGIAGNARICSGATLEQRTILAMLTETGRMSKKRTTINGGARILHGTTVMGGVVVGRDAVVGPHAFVTHSVKPESRARPLARH